MASGSERDTGHLSDESPVHTGGYSWFQRIGLALGIALFLITLVGPTPAGLSSEAQRVAAVALLMAIWWITEAIPLFATALIPLALLPLLGVFEAKQVAASYAEPTIFLFMGGFFLSVAMQRWGLHKRIAYLTIHVLGTNPKSLLLGVMTTTAMISLWVSNTATTLMIYPIALALLAEISQGEPGRKGFGTALMLGIPYAAAIGGVGTLIGTAPNAIFAGQAKLLFPELGEVTFLKWMMVGLPYVILFLPIAWFYLAQVHVRTKSLGEDFDKLPQAIGNLKPISKGELGVFFVFLGAVLGWIFRKDIALGGFVIPGWSGLLSIGSWVDDSTVAFVATMLLFLIPVNIKRGEFLLNWEWAAKIPWGILILLGGGFALAASFQETERQVWPTGWEVIWGDSQAFPCCWSF